MIIQPAHMYIRRRTAARFRDSLRRQEKRIVKTSDNKRAIVFPPERHLELFSTVNSYLGLFSHASCNRLFRAILQDHPFLSDLYYFQKHKAVRYWKLGFRPKNLFTQYQFFRRRFRGLIVFQVGCFLELYNRYAVWAGEKRYWL